MEHHRYRQAQLVFWRWAREQTLDASLRMRIEAHIAQLERT